MKRPSYRWGYLIAGVGGSRASFTGDACCAGGKMIFTPEESREIAEGMFGWKFFPAKRALVVGEYGEESQEDRKSTRLNSSHRMPSRMPSSA